MSENLNQAVTQLDEGRALKLVRKMVKAGVDPVLIQEQIRVGMVNVGLMYEKGEYFIADLIMSGKIFEEALKVLLCNRGKQGPKRIGKILIGTVLGDVHDIGKNIVKSMLEAENFEVIDLGVDVPSDVFVEKIREVKPQIVALSGVLTLAIESMKKTINALAASGLRNQVKVIVGGTPITKDVGNYLKADSFTNRADKGIAVCKEWVKTERIRHSVAWHPNDSSPTLAKVIEY
jgi:methanogenic corrinoid protein MtbC1